MVKYPFNYRNPRNIAAKRHALSKEDINLIQELCGSFNIAHKEKTIPTNYDDLVCSRAKSKSWKDKNKNEKQYE